MENKHQTYRLEWVPENSLILYQYRMMRQHAIEALVPLAMHADDTCYKLNYEIGPFIAASLLFKEPLGASLLIQQLLSDLLDTLFNIKQHLLEACRLSIQIEDIYYHPCQKRFYFLYLPLLTVNHHTQNQIKSLFEAIMPQIHPSDEKGLAYCHRVVLLVTQSDYTLEALKALSKASKGVEPTLPMEQPITLKSDPERVKAMDKIRQWIGA